MSDKLSKMMMKAIAQRDAQAAGNAVYAASQAAGDDHAVSLKKADKATAKAYKASMEAQKRAAQE